MHQFFFSGFKIYCNHKALNKLGDFSANHVRTEKLTGLLVENGFNQPLIFTKCNGLTIGSKLIAANANIKALLFGFGFSQTNGCNLRVTIGATRILPLSNG